MWLILDFCKNFLVFVVVEKCRVVVLFYLVNLVRIFFVSLLWLRYSLVVVLQLSFRWYSCLLLFDRRFVPLRFSFPLSVGNEIFRSNVLFMLSTSSDIQFSRPVPRIREIMFR